MMTFQLFGLGRTKNCIDLFCRVESIEADGIKFYVINGGWHGLYRPDSIVVCFAPDGNTEQKVESCYLDPVPKFRNECYDQAIAWMNGELVDDIDQYLVKELPAGYFADMDDDIPF